MRGSPDFELLFKQAAVGLGILKHSAAPEDAVLQEDTSIGAPAVPTPKVTAYNYFSHPDAHPIVLDLALLRRYGPEWLEWETETINWRVAHDFKQTISELNAHKIQAAKTLHLVGSYWQEWHIFCWVTMAFTGIPPDFHIMQVPTVAQAMVSVDIANRIRQDVPFSQEINDYLEQIHMHDGIFCPQEPLTFVTMDDVEEYIVDCAEVQSAWPSVRARGTPPTEETVTAEQLRRMLDVHDILEESRADLRRQLSLVSNG